MIGPTSARDIQRELKSTNCSAGAETGTLRQFVRSSSTAPRIASAAPETSSRPATPLGYPHAHSGTAFGARSLTGRGRRNWRRRSWRRRRLLASDPVGHPALVERDPCKCPGADKQKNENISGAIDTPVMGTSALPTN